MNLRAKVVPYSSIVGGSLALVDETGRSRFLVMFGGTTAGMTKEEAKALARGVEAAINEKGGIDL